MFGGSAHVYACASFDVEMSLELMCIDWILRMPIIKILKQNNNNEQNDFIPSDRLFYPFHDQMETSASGYSINSINDKSET